MRPQALWKVRLSPSILVRRGKPHYGLLKPPTAGIRLLGVWHLLTGPVHDVHLHVRKRSEKDYIHPTPAISLQRRSMYSYSK